MSIKAKSATQKMFESVFFMQTERYPVAIGPLSQGQAVNLAQSLNRANRRWARENNIPEGEISLSAKTRQGNPTSTHTIFGESSGFNELTWFVEISPPLRRHYKSPEWMEKLIQKGDEESPPPPPKDPQEKLLEKFFTGGLG